MIYKETFDIGKNINVELKDQIFYDENDGRSWAPFYEVFMMKDYEYKNIKVEPDDIVVDLGANIGMFSLYAAQNAKVIYSVEPDPNTYHNLCKNGEKTGKIIPINKAVFSTEGTIEFNRNDVSGSSSIFFADKDGGEKIKVQAISFSNLLKENNIDRINFLKVDIEGSEFDLFETMNESFLENNIDKIFMEVHLSEGFKLQSLTDKIGKYFDCHVIKNTGKVALVGCLNKKLNFFI